ncbi:hypothetical protein B484DRAFT_433485 [Ochromonadaceae sp. CCMP2298]|nr:hypothetical protein B484DRAFT_433485 [Ochromonadaceae sp. CCMP2298]
MDAWPPAGGQWGGIPPAGRKVQPSGRSVHVLVAQAFHHEQLLSIKRQFPDEILQVDHVDGEIGNNLPSNLEWVTAATNILRAQKRTEDKKKRAAAHLEDKENRDPKPQLKKQKKTL